MRNDDITSNLTTVLSQISESTRKALSGINMDAFLQTQNMLSQYARQINLSTAGISAALEATRPYVELQAQASDLFRNIYIESNVLSGYSTGIVKQLSDLQSSAALMASLNGATEMIKEVQKSLAASNITGCIQAIQATLDKTQILMPDMALLKTSDLLQGLRTDIKFPSGFLSDMKGLNKSAAIRLADNDQILYRSDLREFVNEESEAKATVSEMNVICGAGAVLEFSSEETFTENELMDFMTYLDDSPMMAMMNEVGKRIFSVIAHFSGIISFDKEAYYHCRARKKDEPPYVWSQMKAAPYGVTFPGRYNHGGQAYFYFADTKDGAETEIRKHMSNDDKENKVLQTVEVSAHGKAKLIDLSAKSLRGLNVFLRYIRFPLAEDNSKRPRAYLIPSFVSECCGRCGIDGIKYYGGKDYSNYVTWSDGFYEFNRNV
jgi:hypothetical protein